MPRGSGRFEIMHNHVGKERGKRLKVLAGGRTSWLGKGGIWSKGRRRGGSRRGFIPFFLLEEDDASHSQHFPWGGVLAAGFQAVPRSFTRGRPAWMSAGNCTSDAVRAFRPKVSRTAGDDLVHSFVWPRGQSCPRKSRLAETGGLLESSVVGADDPPFLPHLSPA